MFLDKIVRWETLIVNASVLVLKTLPSIPTKSPISVSLNKLYYLHQRRLLQYKIGCDLLGPEY